MICSVFVPSDVDPDVVELVWFNEEGVITVDSRVTIVNSMNSSSNYSINFITSIIQFNPLFDDDEGVYICSLVMNGSVQNTSIQLQNFRSMCMIYVLLYYVTSFCLLFLLSLKFPKQSNDMHNLLSGYGEWFLI